MAKFSDRLKEALNNKKMKQVELSRRTGIDKGTISHYLKGDYKPKPEYLQAIAEALNVNEAYLLGYVNDPSRLEDPDLQSFLNQLDESIRMTGAGTVQTPGRRLAESLRAHGVAEDDVQAILLYLTLTEEQKDLMRRWFRMLAEAD